MGSFSVFGRFKLHSFYLQIFFFIFTIFNLGKFYLSAYHSTHTHLHYHYIFRNMMFPAHLGNELSNYVITDFAQSFERETGLNMVSCRNIIQDSNDIFRTFSYLIKHLFNFIDSSPCETLTIKGLTVSQRRDFYIELSQIGIHYTKNRYLDDNNNHCTDICISITNIWSVPDYRTTPELAIYQYHINVFNAFYSRVERFEINRGTTANGNIIVSMENFLKFKRKLALAVTSYNQRLYINYNINNNYIINNIINMPNQPSDTTATATTQRTHFQPNVSSNTKIKHQLADLIFDIKDHLTDAMYKEILEKIALISP